MRLNKLFIVIYLATFSSLVCSCQVTNQKPSFIDLFYQGKKDPSYLIWRDKFEENKIISVQNNFDSKINDSLFHFIRIEYENDIVASRIFQKLVEDSFDTCANQVSFHLMSSYSHFLLVKSDNYIELFLYDFFRETGNREKFLLTVLLNRSNLILHKISCRGILYQIKKNELHKYYLKANYPGVKIFESYFDKNYRQILSIDNAIKLVRPHARVLQRTSK